MSFLAQAQLAADQDFTHRVTACASTEVPHSTQPTAWTGDHIWWVAAAPGFADAYESAIVAEVPRPGADPAVISDGQILSAVQALVNEPPP
jgi:hypothetical protein